MNILNTIYAKSLVNEQNDVICEYDKLFIKKIFSNPFIDSKNTNIIMCLLSGLIYKYSDIDILDGTCKSWGLTNDNYNIYNIDNKELVFGIFVIQKTLIIVFKGSSSFKDFLTDINFVEYDSPVDYTLGKVHKGIYNRLFNTENIINGVKHPRCEIIIDLVKKYPDNYNIYLTGHSLGGGLATSFYQYLNACTNMSHDIKLVTFGSPRVGDSVFVNSMNINCSRFVNKNDIVPHLPLSIYGYKHIPTKIHIPLDNTDLHASCFKLNTWSLDDHGIDQYFFSLI